jgi:hypothetical protein
MSRVPLRRLNANTLLKQRPCHSNINMNPDSTSESQLGTSSVYSKASSEKTPQYHPFNKEGAFRQNTSCRVSSRNSKCQQACYKQEKWRTQEPCKSKFHTSQKVLESGWKTKRDRNPRSWSKINSLGHQQEYFLKKDYLPITYFTRFYITVNDPLWMNISHSTENTPNNLPLLFVRKPSRLCTLCV